MIDPLPLSPASGSAASASSAVSPVPSVTPVSATPASVAHPVTHGTLAHAALPGAAFSPDDFNVEVTQTALAEADELLKTTLDEAMESIGGNRAFLALVDTLSGELTLRFTAGPGWTEDIRRLRVDVHSEPFQDARGNGHLPPARTRLGITRHVVVNGRRYWTGDVSRDPYYVGFFDDVRSEIAVPITARGGGTVGVINIESPQADAFTEEHANVLAALARRAALIIAMAEHQLREEALISIGKDFNSTADLDILMQDVVGQATKILRADDCSLLLMDESGDELRLVASTGDLREAAGRGEATYDLGEGLTGWVAQNARVVRVGDPRTDPRWKGLYMEAPPAEIAALMAVPVLCQRSKPGVLRVVRRRKGSLYFLPQEFTRVDEDVLVTLAGQLAVAIDRTRLTERLLNSERMAAWGEMSARSAHMIGNTVFGIKGHLNELNYALREKASRDGGKPQPSDEDEALPNAMVESITRGIYRLEEILGEFRDFVLATQLHPAETDLNALLRTVAAESFPRHSKVDLALNLAPQLPLCDLDEVKLKRAFAELIENAVDFQPEGGSLTIRTSLADAEIIKNQAPALSGQTVLQVEFMDAGPGLSDRDRERVFDPFYTRKAKGMGLGLSIVKGIIEAHRGVIKEVGGVARDDVPTRGAHFLVLLPARQR